MMMTWRKSTELFFYFAPNWVRLIVSGFDRFDSNVSTSESDDDEEGGSDSKVSDKKKEKKKERKEKKKERKERSESVKFYLLPSQRHESYFFF